MFLLCFGSVFFCVCGFSSNEGKQRFVARAAELDKADLINLLGQYFDRVRTPYTVTPYRFVHTICDIVFGQCSTRLPS